MITEFHFDKDFLENEKLVDCDVTNQYLLDQWINYGCLCYPFALGMDYIKSLELHDPKFINDWKTAFDYSLKCDYAIDYKDTIDFKCQDELAKLIHKNGVKIALICDDVAKKLGNSNINKIVGGVEIFQPEKLSNSQFFSESRKLSQQDIKISESIDHIWKSRLLGLAKHTYLITIID